MDPDGDTSSTDADQTFYLYEMGQVVLEFNKTGTGDVEAEDLAHRYLWGPAVDRLLADEQVESLSNASLNETLWALTDHLGSVRDVVDNNGTLRIHRDYDSFGADNQFDQHYDANGNWVSEGQAGFVDLVFGYTGRQFDDETGLQNNLNRWYDPAVGRWISEDPIGFAAGDANLARYVGNMPTMYVDPSGLVGDGHHFVNRANWRGMSQAVVAIFDSTGARIRNDFYKFHDGSTVNGITHNCSNQEIGKELNAFLGGRDVSTMTPDEARAFLRRVKTSKNPIIAGFNKGVRAEAYAARQIGEAAYRRARRAGLSGNAAYRAGVDAAEEKVLSTRRLINDRAAKAAKKTLGRRLLGFLPFVGAGAVACETGSANATGREAFLELTGLDFPRDVGLLMGDAYDAIVEDGNRFRDQVREKLRP